MSYAVADAINQLQTTGNTIRFRYEHLDTNNNSKGFIQNIVQSGGSITHDYKALIKRVGNINMVDTNTFDFVNDRIRPWQGVLMPDGTWFDFPLGLFLVSTPGRHYDGGLITRQCTLYDQTQILVDLVPTNISLYGGYFLPAGAVYTDEIVVLLHNAGITNINIIPSTYTLPSDRLWKKGNLLITSKQINDSTVWALGANTATIINDLLLAINYAPLWFDGMGQAQCQPFVRADSDSVDHFYATNNMSIIQRVVDQNADLLSVPNVVILAVVQPDRIQLVSQFVNSDPSSPVSTVSRNRRVVLFDTSIDAPDQPTLDALAHQKAIDAANIYETVTWSSPPMPNHGDRDIIQFTHTGLSIVSANYAEIKWTMALQAGGTMSHTMQRVVNIDGSLLGNPDSG